MQWFGDPWPPELMWPGDPSERVATPVDQICPLCHEPIRRLDRGYISEMVDGALRPRHLECTFALLVVGADFAAGGCFACGLPALSWGTPSRWFQARQVWDHYSDFHRPQPPRGRHRA